MANHDIPNDLSLMIETFNKSWSPHLDFFKHQIRALEQLRPPAGSQGSRVEHGTAAWAAPMN